MFSPADLRARRRFSSTKPERKFVSNGTDIRCTEDWFIKNRQSFPSVSASNWVVKQQAFSPKKISMTLGIGHFRSFLEEGKPRYQKI
jgi:hypothetical protein